MGLRPRPLRAGSILSRRGINVRLLAATGVALALE